MAPASAVAKPEDDDAMIVDKLPAKSDDDDDDDDAMLVDKLPEEINGMKIKDERVEKVVCLYTNLKIFYGHFVVNFFFFRFFNIY